MPGDWTIVIDIGKSLSKATLWDEGGVCRGSRSRPNRRLMVGQSYALDATGIEQWLQGVFAHFATVGPVGAIVPVAHGAGAALIRNGRLACAPVDYEWPGVAYGRRTYDNERDPFALTGSPPLPAGLNLGMQLHWLDSLRSGNFKSCQIIPWAQYWAWVLCGVAASEVTSLGCHSDLWRPYARIPSNLSVRRGWAERLAPLSAANAVLGTLTQKWAEHTGLSSQVQILCGLHDSNAALLAARNHAPIEGREATVLSTGTWFVAMRSPSRMDPEFSPLLAETRDCLVNVDVEGAAVPSSRFMGGREIEILVGADRQLNSAPAAAPLIESAMRTIQAGDMILPSGVPGVGPYPNAIQRHVHPVGVPSDPMTGALLYAALLADVALDLIGSRDCLIIDGRFSQEPVFTRALASLRPSMTVLVNSGDDGVARGALNLLNRKNPDRNKLEKISPIPIDMNEYRARWRDAAEHAA